MEQAAASDQPPGRSIVRLSDHLAPWPLVAAFCLIALPWLNPFTHGPTAAVVPFLVSLACAAALLLVCGGALGRLTAAQLEAASARAWLAAALLSATIGVLQYFGATALFGPWVNATQVGEAFANLRQRNQFATLTNIGLVALAWLAVKYREQQRWRLLAAAILLVTANAASSSRTGLLQLLALAVIAGVWGGWRQPDVRRALVVSAMAYAAAAAALPVLAGLDATTNGILARLREGDVACASRLTLWNNVLYLIAQKPWLGWGWGELDYAHFITLYPGARFCDILDNAHNLPLHLAVELGVPVAALACSLGLWLVWRTRPWAETHPVRQMAWAVLAVILLHSMLEFPLWYGPFQMAACLAVWILVRSRRVMQAGTGAQDEARSQGGAVLPSPRAKLAAVCLAIVLAVCVGYAAWDYHRISQIYLPTKMRAPAYRENTLEKIRGSWLFRNQVRFAEFTTTELNPANAADLRAMGWELLHFSPEARVVEKLAESALMLRRDDEALALQARYRVAFPREHALWVKTSKLASSLPSRMD